jgi:hypothetical protein
MQFFYIFLKPGASFLLVTLKKYPGKAHSENLLISNLILPE